MTNSTIMTTDRRRKKGKRENGRKKRGKREEKKEEKGKKEERKNHIYYTVI